MPAAGADVIEIGMPFTDPMADGPSIQASSLRALKSGMTLRRTIQLVQEFRAADADDAGHPDGLLQPDLLLRRRRGSSTDAKAAGVDGLIVVDLPPEEDVELCVPALNAGVNFIRLATPTTDDKRMPTVLQNTSGFVYYVSDRRHHRGAAPRPRTPSARGRTASPPHRPAGRRRLRHQHPGSRPPPSRVWPTPPWSAPPSSTASRANLDENGLAAPGLVDDVLAFVRTLADGVRAARG